MKNSCLYTIGYGNKAPEEFIRQLKELNIEYLIDVRSQPYSKFNPPFSQTHLKFLLRDHGIRYVHMGDSLGGKPNDSTCYDSEGKVDYEIVRTKDFFITGINRLKKAIDLELNVVIMCTEIKPYECHRSKLIGNALESEGIGLQHIDEKGHIKSQIFVANCMTKGHSETNLFGDKLVVTSKKSYL